MNHPRICIVTFAWPPRNSIAAHRPYSWAKYWSLAGAKVLVITARKYSYDAPLDLQLPGLPGVEVIEIDYASKAKRVGGWLLGGWLRPLAKKVYRSIFARGTNAGNPREAWVAACAPYIAEWADRSDFVVSTYDPRGVHQIAAAMKARCPRLMWIADYRDLWSFNHAAHWSETQRHAERDVELATVGEHADFITSVSDELAEHQGVWLQKPYATITNGFDVDPEALRAALKRRLAKPTLPLRIVYTGKIYPGTQDISPLLDTIVDLESAGHIPRGAIEVHVYGGQTEGLDSVRRTERFRHLLRVHGHVRRDEALAAQSGADILLLMESSLPQASGVLTGKVFEYISTGVPILSLGSRRSSAIGALLRETRTGICTEDSRETISVALKARLAGEDLAWFSPSESAILTYTRERQAMALYDVMLAGSQRKNWDYE